MNHCPECGVKLGEQKNKFCSNCGFDLRDGWKQSGFSQLEISEVGVNYLDENIQEVPESDRSEREVAKVNEQSLSSKILANQKELYNLLHNFATRVQSDLEKLSLQQEHNVTTLQAEILEIKEELQGEREERSQQQIDEERLANFKKWFSYITRAVEKLEDDSSSTTRAGENFEDDRSSTRSRKRFSSPSPEVEKNVEKEPPFTIITTSEENLETQNDDVQTSDESEDTVLTLEEEQLLKNYKENTDMLSEKAIVVAEAKKSIEENRLDDDGKTILEEHRRGNYWIVKQNGLEYLVPRSKIKINEYNRKTVERLFECRGFNKEKPNDNFELLKPAKVLFMKEENQWEVTEKGILEFG